MGNHNLYRLSCSVDAVLAAASIEDALAYADSHRHDVRVEALDSAEALVSLSGEEAVMVLASIERTLKVQNGSSVNREMLESLVERITEALGLIEEQEALRS